MASSPVQDFFRFQAPIYDATRWLVLRRRRHAVARLGLRPDSRVLEVGCGTGLNFRHVLKRLDPATGNLVGVDFSAEMLARAARRIRASRWINVELVEGDAARLDLGRSFDAVLFGYSLSMIPDWPAALDQAREHLRPGGRLVVLDFGQFERWGPLAPVARAWLRRCHVDVRAPYLAGLLERFAAVELEYWLGGYCFIAMAMKD